MSYIRIKWIKGHPYLYEQSSYRVGKKVKTRHIRYIGKYGYRSAGGRGARPGFQPPAGLTAERRDYIDRYISKLTRAETRPYEREILRTFLYHQSYEFHIFTDRRTGLQGEVQHTGGGEVVRFALRTDSHAFVWMHELGHALELGDNLLDKELTELRLAFRNEIFQAYREACLGGLESKSLFLQRFGKLINIRQTLETWIPDSKPVEDKYIDSQLERVRAGEIPELSFNMLFEAWVNEDYRLRRTEILADSVSALILNPEFAFEVHGEEGKQYLSRLYIRLYRHLEAKYRISLGRPKEKMAKPVEGLTL